MALICRKLEKEGTSKWATSRWDRERRSPDVVVFEYKERCPQTGFLRKREGHIGVGFFLSHLSPPPHQTPTLHNHPNLLLLHVVIFSPKVGEKESISRWVFFGRNSEKEQYYQLELFSGKFRKKQGTPKISFFFFKKKTTMVLVSSRTKILSEDHGQANQTLLH